MTSFTIRRLGPEDGPALAQVARDETDFTDEPPSPPLTPDAARAYLSDPGVWHWHAEDAGGNPVGFLMAYVHRRRHGEPLDVMFEEIGVRRSWRRRGVGRALVDALHAQMRGTGSAACGSRQTARRRGRSTRPAGTNSTSCRA